MILTDKAVAVDVDGAEERAEAEKELTEIEEDELNEMSEETRSPISRVRSLLISVFSDLARC
jgi:hypothetical protein